MAVTSLFPPHPGWRFDAGGTRGWFDASRFATYREAKSAGRENIVSRREYLEKYQNPFGPNLGGPNVKGKWAKKVYYDAEYMRHEVRSLDPRYKVAIRCYGKPYVLSPPDRETDNGFCWNWLWGIGDGQAFSFDAEWRKNYAKMEIVLFFEVARSFNFEPPKR